MKILIHDIKNDGLHDLYPKLDEDIVIFSPVQNIKKCVGCFNCWVKTPGKCIIKDGFDSMGKLLSKCEELIIISEIFYGGYSPFVKNVLDRSIGYLLPYFRIVNNRVHHKARYKEQFKLSVIAYGDINDGEKYTISELVTANAVNMNISSSSIVFTENIRDIRKVREVL